MIKKTFLWAIVIAMAIGVIACKKDDKTQPDTPKPGEEVKTHTFDTRAFDKWVYFSFAEDKEVEIADFQTSIDWDIAFHRFDVRVNCGTAGPGQGGSISMGQVKFEDVTEAPTEGYSLNDSISIVNKPGGWMDQVMVPGDTIVANWMHFSGPPPTYNISNDIYVVKTADGKYAKIWLKDYYNDNSESGFITMQYFYQKDGSKKLM